MLQRLVDQAEASPGDLRDDARACRGTITGFNLCALGDSIEPFLKSVLKRFPEQFESRIVAETATG